MNKRLTTKLSIERDELAQLQATFTEALLKGEDSIDMIDADQLMSASQALYKKRVRTIEQGHPELKRKYADDYEQMIRLYCAAHPGVNSSGPCADAKAFDDFANDLRIRKRFQLLLKKYLELLRKPFNARRG